MSSVRHLDNAPVKEAIIDCQFLGNWTRELSDVCKEIAGRNGRVSDLFETMFTLTVKDSGGEAKVDPSSNSRVGKRIDFDDARQVAQVQRTGFTFSQLEPYGSWDQVVADASKLWNILRPSVSDLQVTRLTVRYINAVDLPVPFDDFSEYLPASPHIPPDLPQGVSQFLIRTVSPVDNDVVTVTQSFKGEIQNDIARVVLDIEVSCAEAAELLDTSLIVTLNRLRDRKNAVFFNYLTEKALELYK